MRERDDYDALARVATKATDRAKARANGEDAEPWQQPDLSILSIHREPAPAFPVEVFGPFWARWISDAGEAKNSPPDYVALPLLAGAGALVANVRRGSPWSGWSEPPIVWVQSVGNPSSGKSPGLDAVTDLIKALEQEADSDFDDRKREHTVGATLAKNRRATWEADVASAVKSGHPPPRPPADMETPDPPTRRRLSSSDPTVEKLGRLAAANTRGFILVRDELAGWLGGMDRYNGGGSDRAFYLEAFGGRSFCIDRVKDADAVRVPFLSVAVAGGVQPDRLATLLFKGDDDGLAARFLYAWPEPRPPRRPRRSLDEEGALTALRWLMTLPQDDEAHGPAPRIVPLEPTAADALQAFREHVYVLERNAAGLFLSWLGKLPGVAVRVALILELLWWCGDDPLSMPEPANVGLKAMQAAVGFLGEYALPMARRAFGDAALPEAERDAGAMARWLVAQRPVPAAVNARTLRHAGALPTRVPARFDAALAELEEAGWVRPAPDERAGPGRKRKDWEVNPALRRRA